MWILNWSGYVNTSCIYQYFQYQYEKAKYYLDRVTLLTVFCKNVLFTYKTQSKSNGFGCFTTWNVSIQLTILQILHLRNIWIWYWNHGTMFHHELECSLMNGTAIAFLDLFISWDKAWFSIEFANVTWKLFYSFNRYCTEWHENILLFFIILQNLHTGFELFLMENRHTCIPNIQWQGCWWPGTAFTNMD